jgi:hypothetical protein
MGSLGTELPREMARVRDEVIPAYESLRRRPNVIVEPQIAMMKADLDRAAKALTEGNVVEMLRVYQILKEWQT